MVFVFQQYRVMLALLLIDKATVNGSFVAKMVVYARGIMAGHRVYKYIYMYMYFSTSSPHYLPF